MSSRKNKIPSEVELESKSCPISGTIDDEFCLKGFDRLHNLPGEFTIVKSKQSGLLRTNPRPSPRSIGYYYPDDYGPYKSSIVNDQEKKADPLWKKIVNFFLPLNINKIPKIKAGHMLEIGCASGSFMHKMARKGWQVEGIEFSKTAAANAKALGYKVHIGTLEEAPEPENPFDLIVGWMVLEHLHDPVSSLEKLLKWSVSNGWLVLSIPNAGSLEFKIFKDSWYELSLPTHLYHFTPKTIKLLLEKSGWKLQKIYHQKVVINFFVSFGYFLSDIGIRNGISNWFINFPKRHGGIKHRLLFPFAYLLALFGQTGRMTVWAQKVDNDTKE